MIVDVVRNDLGRIAKLGTCASRRSAMRSGIRSCGSSTSTVGATSARPVALRRLPRALPAGIGDGCAEDPRDVDHSRARGAASRDLLRCRRDDPTGWRRDVQRGDPDRMDRRRAVTFLNAGGGMTPTRPRRRTARRSGQARRVHAADRSAGLFETIRVERGVVVAANAISHVWQHPLTTSGCHSPRVALRTARRAIARSDGADRCARGSTFRRTAPSITALDAPADHVLSHHLPVAFAPSPVDRRDVWLYHKYAFPHATTKRPGRGARTLRRRALEQRGRGDRADAGQPGRGARRSALTPPLDCGLLNGVLRAELLEAGLIARASP